MKKFYLKIWVFILSFSLLKGEIKIEKVLETESVADYNRWVKKNKDKYPELKPIYFQIRKIKDGKYQPDAPITFNPPPEHPSTDIYEITYYNYEKIANYKQIIGYIGRIRVLGNGEYLSIIKGDYAGNYITMVKDKNGNELFELNGNYVFWYLRDSYFIMEPYGEDIPEAFERLPIIDVERGPAPLAYIHDITPSDVFYGSSYIALKTYRNEVVILSRDFKEIWRKKFKYSGEPNAGNKFVTIGNMGKVLIYNPIGELLYTYIPEPNLPKQYAMAAPYSIFINDERFLVSIPPSHKILTLFDLENGKEIWRIELPFPAMISAKFKYIFPIFDKYILLICRKGVVLVGYALVVDQQGYIINKLDFNLPKGEVSVFEGTKAGKRLTLINYEWEWKAHFQEPFLIITGRKNRKISIDKFIVYKFTKTGE